MLDDQCSISFAPKNSVLSPFTSVLIPFTSTAFQPPLTLCSHWLTLVNNKKNSPRTRDEFHHRFPKKVKMRGENPLHPSDTFKHNHFNASTQASDPRLNPVCHPSRDASDASTDASSTVLRLNPVIRVNRVKNFPPSEPEKKTTFPEDQRLMPENEPENILKIQLPARATTGTVASLHIHPRVAGEPLIEVPEFNLVAEKGIAENKRYFARVNYGKPSKRQVTLIEREIIAQHAAALGANFDPGQVRSNIETTGIDLVALLGQKVQIGEALLIFVEPRNPCHKMDALAPGLRALMENSRQGVIARVVKSGCVRPGDAIQPVATDCR
jgi:hypothetical protein